MLRAAVVLTGALLAVRLPGAFACGFCIEDKVAAAYDHVVIKHAIERGHEVVFVEIAGGVPLTSAQWRSLAGTVERISGVVRGSTRSSVTPQVLSFELDAARSSSATALREVNEKLHWLPARVELVKILNERQGVVSR